MSGDILAFCVETILSGKTKRYANKKFSNEAGKSLIYLARQAKRIPNQHPTHPAKFSEDVSTRNQGETAFQRAIFDAGKKPIILDDPEREPITWQDLELPITFSTGKGKGRRRCVDLIGRIPSRGSFLCELKYAKDKPADGNAADYAVLEALIYFGIIKRDWNLLDEVRRPNRIDPVVWEDVASSNTIMVLANRTFWQHAKREPNKLAITKLTKAIHERLKIKVLLVATKDYKFHDSNITLKEGGRYCPKLMDDNDSPWTLALQDDYKS